MTSKRKNFIAPEAYRVSTSSLLNETAATLVVGTSVSYNGDTLDLSRWLGRGIDEWVWASVNQLRAFLAADIQTKATVITHGRQAIPAFFEFLLATRAKFKPSSIENSHVLSFIEWVKSHPTWGTNTQRNIYTLVKSVLLGMHRRGVVPLKPESFPNRPIFHNHKDVNGAKPLSGSERSRLAEAIRLDVIDIHHGNFTGGEIDILTVYAIAIGMRTGMNTTPLLELGRDALGPHPFMPNMKILRSFKRRGNATHLKAMRKTDIHADPTSIPMDGVALFEKVIERTKPLLSNVSPRYKNHLWLYKKTTKSGEILDEVAPLSSSNLARSIASLVERHGLCGDDGVTLRLNMSRLRKTMENRLWMLSNGDLFSVALIMGHHPRVADTNYLHATQEMRRNATFVAAALPVMYQYGVETQGQRPTKLDKTPVGSCKDSLFGELAPNDGVNHCGDFMSCFLCRSYAVVGSIEDLHRLFSFYWFLTDEMRRIKSNEWREQHAWTLSQIDAFTQANFSGDLVDQAKNLAKNKPHEFWKNYQLEARKMGAKNVI